MRGEMNCILTIQKQADARNEWQDKANIWNDINEVWAKRKDLDAETTLECGEYSSITKVNFWIDKIDITEQNRIICDGDIFKIMSIGNAKKEQLLLECINKGRWHKA